MSTLDGELKLQRLYSRVEHRMACRSTISISDVVALHTPMLNDHPLVRRTFTSPPRRLCWSATGPPHAHHAFHASTFFQPGSYTESCL